LIRRREAKRKFCRCRASFQQPNSFLFAVLGGALTGISQTHAIANPSVWIWWNRTDVPQCPQVTPSELIESAQFSWPIFGTIDSNR
jgi:hypothetical protein